MSHHATNWAIQQRGLKPALKVVLWHLADRHHRDNGCFPSQDTLADDCEVPRSTLNVYLDELERRGLIARERRRIDGSQKMARTRYYFPFEPEFTRFSGEKPSPETGHGSDIEAESRNRLEPSPENGKSRVQNLDSNPVREPVKEPVTEREARERDLDGSGSEEDGKVVLKEFRRWYQAWPAFVDSKDALAERAWLALTPEERLQAVELSEAYCEARKRIGRTIPISAQVYLSEKRWTKIEAMTKAQAERKSAKPSNGRATVGVFGPAFGAAHALALLDGPVDFELPVDLRKRVAATYEVHARRGAISATSYRDRLGLGIDQAGRLVFPEDFEAQEHRRRLISQGFPEANRLSEAAKERTHVTVDARFEGLKDLMEFVPIGSDMWARWEAEHAVRCWPFLPTPQAMKGAYFPAGGPDGLDEFERAVRSRLETRTDYDAA